MTENERDALRALAAQFYKLADEMNVNVQPTRAQCLHMRELAGQILRIINAEISFF